MTAESVCSRVASTDEVTVVTAWGLPEEGVRLMPTIGRVKLNTLVPVGGVSLREIVKLALPLVVQFVVQTVDFEPQQEVRMNIAEMPRIRRERFEFMQTPHFRFYTRLDG